jgi:GDP-L-fucose synthase
MHEAKQSGSNTVTLWGTGTPKRELIHVSDFVSAVLFLMEHYKDYKKHINIGVGSDITIKDLAILVAKIIGYEGGFIFDQSKPDGTQQRLLDNKKLVELGWKPERTLEKGIKDTYESYLSNSKQ